MNWASHMNQPLAQASTEQRSCCVLTGTLAELWPPEDDRVTVRTVSAGESATTASDSPDSVYYVRRGLVKAMRYSGSGDEVIIDYYWEGSLFGGLCFCEWPLCEEGIEREVAVAVEASEIVVMKFDNFKAQIRERPEALLGLLSDYCRRLAAARTRIESFVFHGAEERLARALLMLAAQNPDSDDPVQLRPVVTHKELAHLIGISRQVVTKLIRRFRERGLIESPSAGHLIGHRRKMAQSFNL